jgi:hypothetical protein
LSTINTDEQWKSCKNLKEKFGLKIFGAAISTENFVQEGHPKSYAAWSHEWPV